MFIINQLWNDESGSVLTAEAVLLGTVGVLGAVAGLSTISHAVDEELQEAGMAIRSLDQSYRFCGQRGCGAWTAGSCFRQEDVESALDNLQREVDDDVQSLEKWSKKRQKSPDEALPILPGNTGEPEPVPNDLPKQEPAPRKSKHRMTL